MITTHFLKDLDHQTLAWLHWDPSVQKQLWHRGESCSSTWRTPVFPEESPNFQHNTVPLHCPSSAGTTVQYAASPAYATGHCWRQHYPVSIYSHPFQSSSTYTQLEHVLQPAKTNQNQVSALCPCEYRWTKQPFSFWFFLMPDLNHRFKVSPKWP